VGNICLLLLLLLLVALLDVEVAELVDGGLGSDHTEPITDLVLLEELLSEVLKVLLGEASRGLHSDLVAVTGHSHDLAESTSLAVDLYLLLEELLESDNVEDLILSGSSAVDGDLDGANLLHALCRHDCFLTKKTSLIFGYKFIYIIKKKKGIKFDNIYIFLKI